MITQSVMDFFRDMIVNWISGIGSLFAGIDFTDAGAALGGAASSASSVLFLFLSPAVWGVILAAWGAFMSVWLATAAIAIFLRRGKSS